MLRPFPANVAQWIQAGVGGVVALGSNGEAPFVEEDEAERVIAAARDSVPRDRVLLVGTGRESTRATIAASARAAALGADAVLVRTPSFYKARMTPDVFVRHYTAVADAAHGAGPPLQRSRGDRRQPDGGRRRPARRRIPTSSASRKPGSDTAQFAAFVAAAPDRFAVDRRIGADVLSVALCRRDGRDPRGVVRAASALRANCTSTSAPAATTRRARCSGG